MGWFQVGIYKKTSLRGVVAWNELRTLGVGEKTEKGREKKLKTQKSRTLVPKHVNLAQNTAMYSFHLREVLFPWKKI